MGMYLACYDYGMGGIWFRFEAPSAEDVFRTFPQLVVFSEIPDWLDLDVDSLPVHILGTPPSNDLMRIVKEAIAHRITGELR